VLLAPSHAYAFVASFGAAVFATDCLFIPLFLGPLIRSLLQDIKDGLEKTKPAATRTAVESNAARGAEKAAPDDDTSSSRRHRPPAALGPKPTRRARADFPNIRVAHVQIADIGDTHHAPLVVPQPLTHDLQTVALSEFHAQPLTQAEPLAVAISIHIQAEPLPEPVADRSQRRPPKQPGPFPEVEMGRGERGWSGGRARAAGQRG